MGIGIEHTGAANINNESFPLVHFSFFETSTPYCLFDASLSVCLVTLRALESLFRSLIVLGILTFILRAGAFHIPKYPVV